MTQETALKILKTGVNVFLTGEPGSGKSHTIREYVNYLRDSGIEPAITASTGIAATHIHGMTIHSWSGIGIRKDLSKYEIEAIAEKSHVYKRIERAKILIIDEISMLDAKTLEAADAVCREVKRNPMEAFGGMQVVFVGDFFQLPPVSRSGESKSNFCFNSEIWREVSPIVCYLSEQHRQDDKEYLAVLSAIRKNNWDADHEELIKSRIGIRGNVSGEITRLFSHNENVDQMNYKRLMEIPGEAETFEMESSGREGLVDSLKRGCLSPESLMLKIGAVVMCTKNNPLAGYANGTLGVVVEFAGSEGNPVIETRSGRKIQIEPAEWALEENGKVRAKITQIPLRLAWAITIHKSQGMSMDAAVMDLSAVFEYGQGYVALSRVRRFSGLFLEGLNKKALQVHPEILSKDLEFKYASASAREKFDFMDEEEVLTLHKNFVQAIGGVFVSDEDRLEGRGKRSGKKSRSQVWKKSTHDITFDLFQEGKTIPEIASERGLKLTTVTDHLSSLIESGKIEKKDLLRLIPDTPEDHAAINEIHHIFRTLGTEKLKPVFEHFQGDYSYDTLRFARMVFEENFEG